MQHSGRKKTISERIPKQESAQHPPSVCDTYVILRTFKSSTFDKFENLRYLPIYKQEKAQIIKSSLNSIYASQAASSSFKFVFCF